MADKQNLLPAGTKVPEHIGVIMDGNGRWAKKRGLPRKVGHREGAQTFRTITRHAKKLGVKYFTVYAFSTENWKRPKDEVEAIMDLFEKYLDEVRDFIEENIRICFIGDRSMLRERLQQKMRSVEEDSLHFDSMTLLIAINYGGRDEIAHAARALAYKVQSGEMEASEIDALALENELYTSKLDGDKAPDVDLVIRPSGEQRLSNFMIWQAAYAEFYYTNILWPDFKPKDLEAAVIAYSDRHRRFGGI
ncbi:MAG: isoprenyl transferase [Ruminococcus sp.]|nr:isoprenyl transferase [Ruminococcus sp.]